ncbi:predicted protein [Paecilomyces variotii No. 5]|uniref:Subtilisin-like serine protease n=1 Tax=Byssochlamys spectabilis (strain No. 5 / NBRC 109023) TaxID=1356009 RepID=V5G9G9_BYSSN|nr:predicted protein [Paecilomyces variotii No. 5]
MLAPNGPIPLLRNDAPFTESTELCDKLTIRVENGINRLYSADPDENWLPGYPALSLEPADVVHCLLQELPTPKLDKMHPYLWLVGTQASSHISPLHEQIIRGREIIITENPELHLVWVNNKVFIKPLPRFLLSYNFWQLYLSNPKPVSLHSNQVNIDQIRKAALGYMRTYYYLVRHESDFRLAQREHLIPSGISFSQFVAFTSGFNRIGDHEVSLRYQFGQLRLNRLNLWAKVALRQWQFQKVQWQYADIIAQYYAPLLFLFGILSLVLSAMQVGTQARPEWNVFLGVSAWFSVLTLLFAVIVLVLFAALLLFLSLRELHFALRKKHQA